MNTPCDLTIESIVSGGQTGVDRGTLDAAIAMGVHHGGWCPRGRISEAGPIPGHYNLRETDASEYWVRTEKNVVDSDGTLILYAGEMSGGTAFTFRMTRKHRRPCLCLDLSAASDPLAARPWAAENDIRTLNVAGPRESTAPGIAEQARQFVQKMLG